MNRKILSTVLLLVSSVAATAQIEGLERPTDHRPNLLIVLCDDLGYGDLACYGNKEIKSPNVDAFAAQGLRLTHCFAAAPNCSPSRTGMMTGRTPTRVGVWNWIPFFSPMHVPRSEITIATLLRNAGYQTCHVGKWHLNGCFNLPEQPQPWDHGFNHWFSTQNNALPNHRNPVNFVRNGREVGPLEGYAADLVVDEAIHWLRDNREPDHPFFLFTCFHEPHEPIASAKQYTDLYPSDDPSYSAHHGNVSQMDAAFGRLMKALDDLKLSDNTLVFFTSDNGPAITAMHPHGSSGSLRDKKGYLYEGGIRVPGIIRWPGVISAGSETDQLVSGVDVLPTFCEIAEVQPPTDRALDGISILPLLKGKSLTRTKPLYWHFNRASSEVKVALRDGPWKILARLTTPEIARGGGIEQADRDAITRAQLTGFELYRLDHDPIESNEVSETYPEQFARLRTMIVEKHREVSRESPIWPDWEFARYESQRIVWPDYWINRGKDK